MTEDIPTQSDTQTEPKADQAPKAWGREDVTNDWVVQFVAKFKGQNTQPDARYAMTQGLGSIIREFSTPRTDTRQILQEARVAGVIGAILETPTESANSEVRNSIFTCQDDFLGNGGILGRINEDSFEKNKLGFINFIMRNQSVLYALSNFYTNRFDQGQGHFVKSLGIYVDILQTMNKADPELKSVQYAIRSKIAQLFKKIAEQSRSSQNIHNTDEPIPTPQITSVSVNGHVKTQI